MRSKTLRRILPFVLVGMFTGTSLAEKSGLPPDHAETLAQIVAQHGQLVERVRASRAADPISAMHLRSLEALADDALHRGRLIAADPVPPAKPGAPARRLSRIERWLRLAAESIPPEGFDFTAHLASFRPLLMAFVSRADGSLQFATVQLPPDFSPEREYPLVCYLHGAGPQQPQDFLLTSVENTEQDTLLSAETSPEAAASAQRKVILVAPYGRGSQGYRGIAGEDVWQSLELAERMFRVDASRRYLTGFSMGCSGVFYHAAKNPEYWAAISPASGFYDSSDCWDATLYPALREVPIFLWCGDADERQYAGLQKLLPILKQAGIVSKKVIAAPRIGHTCSYLNNSAVLGFCLTRRKN